MKHTLFLLLAISFSLTKAQCPVISMPNTATITSCNSGITVQATSNYAANISSRWIGPGNVPIASVGTSTSNVYINFPATYTVEFTDNSSNCTVSDTIRVSATVGKPTFALTSPNNFTLSCNNQSVATIYVINASATNSNQIPTGGPVSYQFLPGTYTSNPPPTSTLSPITTYTLSSCGVFHVVVIDNTFLCNSSIDFVIECLLSTPPSVSLAITPSTQVCSGSNVTVTASGATTYTWSNGSIGSSAILTTPASGSSVNLMVLASNPGSCSTYTSILINPNPSCTIVWPGDANSDGTVDTWDIFEIGINFNATGPVRNSATNAYTGQYASTWTGTTTLFSNLAHTDCNGDGVINFSDTMAVFLNYGLNHAFRPAPASGSGLSLVSSENIFNTEIWNSVDVYLGDSANPENQIYGLAFDLDFDASLIATNGAYMSFNSSFLNNNNQNIQFRKADMTSGKIHVASVRTDGSEVSGYGKIATFHFKPKISASGSQLTIGISNTSRTNKSGNINALNNTTSTYNLVDNPLGFVQTQQASFDVHVFPNPSENSFSISTGLAMQSTFTLQDVSGRKIKQGNFSTKTLVDVADVESGIYLLVTETEGIATTIKLVIQ